MSWENKAKNDSNYNNSLESNNINTHHCIHHLPTGRKQVLYFLFLFFVFIPISHQQPGLLFLNTVTPFTFLFFFLYAKHALIQALPVWPPIFFSVPPVPSPVVNLHNAGDGCTGLTGFPEKNEWMRERGIPDVDFVP